MRSARVAIIGLLAVAGLAGTWWLACELLRERSAPALLAFLAGPWLALLVAWQLALPRRGWRAAAALGLALLAADVALDVWLPMMPRYALPGWELLRAALLAASSAIASRPALARPGTAARVAAACARLASLALVALVAGAMGQVDRAARRMAAAEPAGDAALVLGFALDEQGRARPSLVARVEHGVALLRAGRVPVLVMSGGAAHARAPTEAAVMRALALARGAPDRAIVLEARSRSTAENFARSTPVLRALGARRVLVVSEPFHLPRAMVLARRCGLDAAPSPAADSAAWRDARARSYWLFREAPLYLAERARSLVARGGCQ